MGSFSSLEYHGGRSSGVRRFANREDRHTPSASPVICSGLGVRAEKEIKLLDWKISILEYSTGTVLYCTKIHITVLYNNVQYPGTVLYSTVCLEDWMAPHCRTPHCHVCILCLLLFAALPHWILPSLKYLVEPSLSRRAFSVPPFCGMWWRGARHLRILEYENRGKCKCNAHFFKSLRTEGRKITERRRETFRRVGNWTPTPPHLARSVSYLCSPHGGRRKPTKRRQDVQRRAEQNCEYSGTVALRTEYCVPG